MEDPRKYQQSKRHEFGILQTEYGSQILHFPSAQGPLNSTQPQSVTFTFRHIPDTALH